MPGLVPGVHALSVAFQKGVDRRDKPGDDELRTFVMPAKVGIQ
jgi:hypothetical protein